VPRTLQEVKMPAGFSLDDRHTMEFHAEGDRLSVLVDNREVVTEQDATYPTGDALIIGSPGVIFEKAEYRDLGVIGARASTEQWIDGRAEWMNAGNEGDVLGQPDATGARLVLKSLGVSCGGNAMKDVAIRATLRAPSMSPGSYFGLAVRVQSKPG